MSTVDGGGGAVFSARARRGNIRKKKREDDDGEEDAGGEDVRALLEETKREQKYRSRGGGVDAATLLSGGGKGKAVAVVLEDVDEKSMFESQFSAENEGGGGNLTVMEQQMMDFIDKKMSKDKPSEKAERVMTADDELYIIPENMKINEKEQVAIENTAESWLTGIVEVELSMDDKLKNIEDTERAKKQMLENMRKGFTTSAFRVDTKSDKGYQRMDQRDKKKGGRGAAAPKGLTDEDKNMLALPINTNSNFHLSNPVVANVVKKPAAAKPSEGEEGQAPAPKRNDMSSDDMVMEKFKKRFRR